MMRSLFSGVSGLKNHQTRMDVIGNNIANVNTTGYKSSRVTFTDTLQQTLTGASAPTDNVGGTNPKQIGLGSAVGSIDMIMTDGSVQSTGKNTDLCLSGSGFFEVYSKSSGVFYTRDGAFEFDKEGNYVLPGSGLYVQGWTADVNGEINTAGPRGNIVVKAGKSMEATATTNVTYAHNLDASAATISYIDGGDGTLEPVTYDYTTPGTLRASASAPVKITLDDASSTVISGITSGTYSVGDTYNGVKIKKIEGQAVKTSTASAEKPITLTMSDGTTYTMTDGKYYLNNGLPVSTVITAYDSLGNAHEIPVYFTKTKVDATGTVGNEWTVSLTTDVAATATTTTIKEADGSFTTVTLEPITLKFDTKGQFAGGGSNAVLTLQNGSQTAQSVNIQLTDLTQYSGGNTISNSSDGNEMGTLKSISIDSAGVITGTYTNGINRQEGQVAIAQFSNPAGLMKTGSSLYQVSNNSGEANVKTATDLGVTITPSALEMSNVDIANEFSDMIITQRGFQSNSKIITVSDEMLETLVNMKR